MSWKTVPVSLSLNPLSRFLIEIGIHHCGGHIEPQHDCHQPPCRQRRQNTGQNHKLQDFRGAGALSGGSCVDNAGADKWQRVEPVEGDDEVVAHRAKVQTVSQQEQHKRFLNGQQRQQHKLHQVQEAPDGQERVAVDIKAEAPLDVVHVMSSHAAKAAVRVVEQLVGEKPRHRGHHCAREVEIDHHHIDHQLGDIPYARRISKAPGHGTDGQKSREKKKKRRIVSRVAQFARRQVLLVVVMGSVHLLRVNYEVEDLPDGGLEIERGGLEKPAEHLPGVL